MPDGLFNYLLSICDHSIKLCILISLIIKTTYTVAWALYETFILTGLPSFLQTDNGCEFSNIIKGKGSLIKMNDEFIKTVISHFSQLWDRTTMIKGSLRYSESNRGIERFDYKVVKKLIIMMREQSSMKWSVLYKMM